MNTISYHHESVSEHEMLERSVAFYQQMSKRRSIRAFSDRPVPREVIEKIIETAGTSPSGAHKQPWTFCIVQDPELKTQIRIKAEEEEYKSYHGRMSKEWLNDLKPIGTDWKKPFLEIAPWLIVIFKKPYDIDDSGIKQQNYYVNESVGIAVGMLITAIHQAGLVTLTHTPSPMNFLAELLKRPENERAFLLLPVGYPADQVEVPDLKRKKLEEISKFY